MHACMYKYAYLAIIIHIHITDWWHSPMFFMMLTNSLLPSSNTASISFFQVASSPFLSFHFKNIRNLQPSKSLRKFASIACKSPCGIPSRNANLNKLNFCLLKSRNPIVDTTRSREKSVDWDDGKSTGILFWPIYNMYKVKN